MIGVIAAMAPAPAFAMARVASDGAATLSNLEVIADGEAWTFRATIDGAAQNVAILFTVPGDAEGAEIVGPERIDGIAHATAPRLVEFEARDPCAGVTAIGAPGDEPSSSQWPKTETRPLAGLMVSMVAPVRAAQLDPLLGSLRLDAASKERLARWVRDGGKLVLLTGATGGRLRGAVTPAIRVRTRARVLPIGLAAPHVTPGRELAADVYAIGGAAKERAVDLPSRINLPEVAAEDPLDLLRAMEIETVRRERAMVRVAGGPSGHRYFLTLGRQDERRSLELTVEGTPAFAVEWWIRRLWRAPIACEAKARYLENVRVQQKTEIQTYAALTGRPQPIIEARSRERGYLLEGGELRPRP